MTIHVTAEDIAQGERHMCMHCPIALAVQRAFPDAWVLVRPAFADVNQDTWALPADVTRFIYAFDEGRQVEPFSFEMEPWS